MVSALSQTSILQNGDYKTYTVELFCDWGRRIKPDPRSGEIVPLTMQNSPIGEVVKYHLYVNSQPYLFFILNFFAVAP
jgi:hypothetical protein